MKECTDITILDGSNNNKPIIIFMLWLITKINIIYSSKYI